MLQDFIQVKHLREYRLEIRFEDGVVGEIDIGKMIDFSGVFEPLKEIGYFVQGQVLKSGGQSIGRTGLI
jgi:hypothetical protein